MSNQGDRDTTNPVRVRLGESLTDILDLNTWQRGDDLSEAYTRLEREIREAVEQEERVGGEVRQRVLPLINNRPNAPRGAGLFAVTVEQIESAHRHLLFNGATVAADGTVMTHDTLLLTAAQIGVCTVSYAGDTNEFRRQLYRRDVRLEVDNPIDEMIEVLEQRQQRAALGYEDQRDELSNLMRRSLMSYAERAILLRSAPDRWLLGHGSPVPREILTVGLQTMLGTSLELLYELVMRHRKFVFVPSSPRELLITTLGNVLQPLQFLIVDTLYDQLDNWIRPGIYSREMRRRVRDFVEEVGPQVVRGVYRASASAPPYLFYAHIDHAQEAALLALADSTLQEHRGFPVLLDLADQLCRASFEPEAFRTVVQQGYAQAGQPFRYLTERETRR